MSAPLFDHTNPHHKTAAEWALYARGDWFYGAMTSREHFRQVLESVAQKAKAVLPVAINGRLESAVRLVLLDEIRPLEDGRIEVGSCSDPSKTYTLVGLTCSCDDFAHGKAPLGWCKHRIGPGLHKRVKELLAAEPVPGEKVLSPTPAALPEAPASVNVRLLVAGHEVQFTLRGLDEAEVLARLQAFLARQEVQPLPTPAARTSRPSNGQNGHGRINRDYRR